MGRYRDLVNRLAHIHGIKLKCLGHAGSSFSDYPFYLALSRGRTGGEASCRICLAAGIHGDEPAGVEAVVRFLESKPDLQGISLSVFPCLNPVGYDRGTRENGDGVDLNRQFHQSHPPREVSLARRAVTRRRYDFFICCHDDSEANGFYLYEAKRGKTPRLSPSIISAIREMASIDRRPKIEGRINRKGMVIPTNWSRRKTGWPMALYLYRFGTPRCLIFESPGCLPFETQVKIHLKALNHVFSLLGRKER